MDKTSDQRATHDFMKVESFSQLPFIRPAPAKEKAIRLFGIEFNGGEPTNVQDEELNSSETSSNNNTKNEEETAANYKDISNENSSNNRRFECHYCFRNFPTSQALGGHQNAHKRERQQAKRAHLQPDQPHAYAGFVDRYPFGGTTSNYPSWNSSNATMAKFYGGHSTYARTSTPINGNPLGLWRVPAATGVQGIYTEGIYTTTPFTAPDRSSSSTLPPFAGDHELKGALVGSSSSQSRYWHGRPASSMQDHVSLDLHL